MLSKLHKLVLAYSLLPGIGRVKLTKLLGEVGYTCSPSLVLLKSLLSASNYSAINQFLQSDGALFNRVVQLDNDMHNKDIGMVLVIDKLYPYLLRQIPDRPIYFFYKGHIEVLHKPQVAIVGSRKASKSSLRMAFSLSKELSMNGFAITSGLAFGIDCAAHSGALKGSGETIAVMGTGLDTVYPRQHGSIASSILENGCWVSEYIFGMKAIASNFPSRNRIISGLSVATIVVEARLKSGTLITARMAIEQNRDVFAVPGPIEYEGSKGCHRLIKEGAALIESSLDVLEELGHDISLGNSVCVESDQNRAVLEVKPDIFNYLGFDSMSMDELSIISGIETNKLVPMLIELELDGRIECLADCYKRI
jgi:DNA processing protein